MKEKLENRISAKVTESSIKALALIRKNVSELYPKVCSEIITRYVSNKKDIDRWSSIKSEERIEHLPEFLESLRGRWTQDIASQFCPSNLNPEIAEQVVIKIIKRAVIEGNLDPETADNEFRYRCSLGSFLVSEDFTKKLGLDYFVLYNKERRIYYPTKEGRTILAAIGGYASMQKSKGVHGLSKKQRILNAKKAGKKGGAVTLRNRVGIYALTPLERREAQRQAVLASGKDLWNEETINYLVYLTANPEYVYPDSHNHQGLPNWKKIAEQLNSKYRTSRTAKAIKNKYCKIRQK